MGNRARRRFGSPHPRRARRFRKHADSSAPAPAARVGLRRRFERMAPRVAGRNRKQNRRPGARFGDPTKRARSANRLIGKPRLPRASRRRRRAFAFAAGICDARFRLRPKRAHDDRRPSTAYPPGGLGSESAATAFSPWCRAPTAASESFVARARGASIACARCRTTLCARGCKRASRGFASPICARASPIRCACKRARRWRPGAFFWPGKALPSCTRSARWD